MQAHSPLTNAPNTGHQLSTFRIPETHPSPNVSLQAEPRTGRPERGNLPVVYTQHLLKTSSIRSLALTLAAGPWSKTKKKSVRLAPSSSNLDAVVAEVSSDAGNDVPRRRWIGAANRATGQASLSSQGDACRIVLFDGGHNRHPHHRGVMPAPFSKQPWWIVGSWAVKKILFVGFGQPRAEYPPAPQFGLIIHAPFFPSATSWCVIK